VVSRSVVRNIVIACMSFVVQSKRDFLKTINLRKKRTINARSVASGCTVHQKLCGFKFCRYHEVQSNFYSNMGKNKK